MSTWRVTLIDARTDDTFYLDVEAKDRRGAFEEALCQTRKAGRPGKALTASDQLDHWKKYPPQMRQVKLFNHLLKLGQVVQTPGAEKALGDTGSETTYVGLLTRHASGDWGELCAEDIAVNELGLREGDRIMSVYTLTTGVKVWVITESDRSVTTILLPEEY